MTLRAARFESLGPIRRHDAERWLASGDPRKIMYAILRLSLHGPDFAFAEKVALENATHPDDWVRRNSATALSHVARVHGSIDLNAVMTTLVKMLDDPEAGPWADDSLDEIEHHMKTDRRLFIPAPAEPALQRAAL